MMQTTWLSHPILALVAGGMTPAPAGAAPPAATAPTIFAPGIVSSGAHDTAPAFSPDGAELFFGRSTSSASLILHSRRTRGGWAAPTVAPFSGRWHDMEPAMAPDGSYLIFVSNRPARPSGAPVDGMIGGTPMPGKGANLWRVDRVRGGWSAPRRLPDVINANGSIYSPSIAADGTLYFMKPAATSRRFQLFSAARTADGYRPPQPLGFSDGTVTDVDPAVAPDQSFLIFGSARRAGTDIDLFITHRAPGGWGEPVYLGDRVNSRTSDAEPRLGSGGRTLYFSSERLKPVAGPIPPRDGARIAAEMSAWNNGLYNIWQTEVAPLLTLKPTAATGAPAGRRETADEAGLRSAQQRWSEAFVSGDERALGDLLDDNYVSVNAAAQARTKPDVIAAARRYARANPGATASPLTADDEIRMLGSSAVVRHASPTDRSVDVMTYVAGRWVAIYSQHTAPAPATP